MKCAGCHPTTTCQKRRDEASKCANCKGSHISSYKGCPAFKEARSKLLHSRQMHQAKLNNPQNHLQHMQQHQQAARRHQMPPPPATGGQPAGSMHPTASDPEANNRPTYSAVLRSPVHETAPLSPVPGRIIKHQQPAQHNLQKKTISKVMTPANYTQQPSEHRQNQHQHRHHQQFQHQSSNASPCEILLALQRSVEISKVLEEKVNNLSKTVYSVLMALMRKKFGSSVDNHSKSEDTL
ncbi:hypothetical protein KR215_011999 [Drosophila sulfurigaster]|nr:hypothetical protein KR215_011999 [Drosophila sulfurigaster]